jgi:hypothetical protein
MVIEVPPTVGLASFGTSPLTHQFPLQVFLCANMDGNVSPRPSLVLIEFRSQEHQSHWAS